MLVKLSLLGRSHFPTLLGCVNAEVMLMSLLNYHCHYSVQVYKGAEIPTSRTMQRIVQLAGPKYSFCASIQPTVGIGGRNWRNDCR